ncbi:hypothetical protein BKA83DRAFT_4129862 [Pisolithus microcarpus]|nr:hypothetical protein BKA83DRAFT_4129862 [Pisolithus microcarpus]
MATRSCMMLDISKSVKYCAALYSAVQRLQHDSKVPHCLVAPQLVAKANKCCQLLRLPEVLSAAALQLHPEVLSTTVPQSWAGKTVNHHTEASCCQALYGGLSLSGTVQQPILSITRAYTVYYCMNRPELSDAVHTLNNWIFGDKTGPAKLEFLSFVIKKIMQCFCNAKHALRRNDVMVGITKGKQDTASHTCKALLCIRDSISTLTKYGHKMSGFEFDRTPCAVMYEHNPELSIIPCGSGILPVQVLTSVNKSAKGGKAKMCLGPAKNGRNLCAHHWCKQVRSNGPTEEFQKYYIGLTSTQRQAYDDEATALATSNNWDMETVCSGTLH